MKTADKNYYLIIYGSYQELMVGLFQGPQLIKHRLVIDARLSALLVPVIDELLREGGLNVAELLFIGVVNGPGSFSSLRAVLATVNGIAAGSGVPLVGCDGLQAFANAAAAEKTRLSEYVLLVAMNAYNNEYFYHVELVNGITGHRQLLAPSHYGSFEAVCTIIDAVDQPVYVAGTMSALCIERYRIRGGAEIPYYLEEIIQFIAALARQAYVGNKNTTSLQPRYLKEMHFKKLV
jgi:tRNA threonylcarbamoyladenosine biosynthesis protein TsaB